MEQDEEIATIETDKIDVSVNSPHAGTITEFLVSEEATVTVGQDLVRLELGGEPAGGGKQEAGSEPKAPASSQQVTSSQPSGEQEQAKPVEESRGHEAAPDAPRQEAKPQPPKHDSKPQSTKHDSKSASGDEPKPARPGSRDERRVGGLTGTAHPSSHAC